VWREVRAARGVAVTIAAALIGFSPGMDGEASAPYRPDWESVASHEAAPAWFRDARFGINLHWA
jgi:alpha-L-fucosidase